MTKSHSDRTRFMPWDAVGDQIRLIPDTLLDTPAALSFYGSSCSNQLLKKRRDILGIPHNKSNTLAIENDTYFETYARYTSRNTPASYITISYEKHIRNGLKKGMGFAIRNVGYVDNSTGNATTVWPSLIRADNKNGILDWQSDILPIALQRGDGSKEIRREYFNWGWFKTKTMPFNTFADEGADVETAIYFCEKDYDGDMTIETDIETYSYNFRDSGFVVTPDTYNELLFILNVLRRDSYNLKAPKLTDPITGKGLKGNVKNSSFFSMEKTLRFKYPIVIKLAKDKIIYGYTSEIIDHGYDRDRLVIPNFTGGWDSGNRHIGNVDVIPAGIQLSRSYKCWPLDCTIDEGNLHASYIMSWPIKYLQYIWKTQRTNDATQTKIIPKLTDLTIDISSPNDILEYLGGFDIKEEILNGYKRKTTKK